MFSRFLSEKPRPNSLVSWRDSSTSIRFPYSARRLPCCSCSTIRRPISKLVATCRVLTCWLAALRALCTRSRISLTRGRSGSPGGFVIEVLRFMAGSPSCIRRVGICGNKDPGWRGESDMSEDHADGADGSSVLKVACQIREETDVFDLMRVIRTSKVG